jgi:SOS-response transcriptional repressor LexA
LEFEVITLDQLIDGNNFVVTNTDGEDIILKLHVLQSGRCFLQPIDGRKESPVVSKENMLSGLNQWEGRSC